VPGFAALFLPLRGTPVSNWSGLGTMPPFIGAPQLARAQRLALKSILPALGPFVAMK
jgi:hypothetical protein